MAMQYHSGQYYSDTTVSLPERTERVLHMVVEAHIASAKAVSSGGIAKKLGVSSATVRHELSRLETEGYLHQPHVSAGRLPTLQGYAHYASRCIPPQRLPQSHQENVRKCVQHLHGDVLWQQVASLSAALSGYGVVVRLPADDRLMTLEVHFSTLPHNRLLAMVVLETGLLRQVVFELNPLPSPATLQAAEDQLNPLAYTVDEMPSALLAIAKHAERNVARTYQALAARWDQVRPVRVFTQGLANLLRQPESEDPDFVRHAFACFEPSTFDPAVLDTKTTPDATVLGAVAPFTAAHFDTTDTVADNDISHHATDISYQDASSQSISPEYAIRQTFGNAIAIAFDDVLAAVSAKLYVGHAQGELVVLGPTRMRYPTSLMVAHGVSETLNTLFAS